MHVVYTRHNQNSHTQSSDTFVKARSEIIHLIVIPTLYLTVIETFLRKFSVILDVAQIYLHLCLVLRIGLPKYSQKAVTKIMSVLGFLFTCRKFTSFVESHLECNDFFFWPMIHPAIMFHGSQFSKSCTILV